MFRRGGAAGGGIMSNVVERRNYANSNYGDMVKEYYDEMKPITDQIYGEPAKREGLDDPLTQWLLTAGPSVMSSAVPGGTLANIGAGVKDANTQLFKDLGDERKMRRVEQGQSKGAAFDIAGNLVAKKIAADATGTDNSLYTATLDKWISNDLPPQAASRAANFEVNEMDSLREQVGSSRYGGVIDFDMSDIETLSKNQGNIKKLKSLNGRVVYDPFSNTYKRIEIDNNGNPGVTGEWSSIAEINLPKIAKNDEPIVSKDKSKGVDIFSADLGYGQQMLAP